MNLMDLHEPFLAKHIKWRVGRAADYGYGPMVVILPYVDARAAMNRIDEVITPACWQDEYTHLSGGVECRIGILIDGRWVYKVDGSPETKIEAFKGGYSKSFVRCGVKWGIGRYLYNLPEVKPEISMDKPKGREWHYEKMVKAKKEYAYHWKVPDKVTKYLNSLCAAKVVESIPATSDDLSGYIFQQGDYEGVALIDVHVKELAKWYHDFKYVSYPDDERNAKHRTDLCSIEFYLKRFEEN